MLTSQQLQQLKIASSPQAQNSQELTPEQAMASFPGDKQTQNNPSFSTMDLLNPSINPNKVSENFKSGIEQVKKGYNQTVKGTKNKSLTEVGQGILNEGTGMINTITSPITEATKIVSKFPIIHQALGGVEQGINWVADKISNNKQLQDFMTKNPNSDEVIGNLITIGMTIAGGKNSGEIKPIIENTANKLKEIVTPTVEKIKNIGVQTPEQLAIESTKKIEDLKLKAIQDTTPAYNKKIIGENPITNADGSIISRVSEAKGLNKRVVNPTPKEILAGEQLSQVPNYNPNATALDKYNTVKNFNIIKAKELETSLKNEKVIIPKKEIVSIIKKAVDSASENSLLLQKTDPIVKNYMRVVNNAVKIADGTIAGELEIRKALDKAYQDAGGEYANNKGLDQIHREARNAINSDMEVKAQTTQVKASLKEQSNLYNALDVLLEKARIEGGSKWEQFKKEYPIISKIGNKVLNVAGLGEGVNILNH